MEFCEWLRETSVSIGIRESLLLFPVLEGTHLLGLGMSAGTIAISDLRLAGVVFKKQPCSEVFNQIFPWMVTGFMLMMVTGVFLFWSEPMRCYDSWWFTIKMVFMTLAGVNAGFYHMTIWRSRDEWDHLEEPPGGAKFAGWASLAAWAMVIIAGRTMAYSF